MMCLLQYLIFEDIVMKRMKAMRDAKELQKKENILALIAQAI